MEDKKRIRLVVRHKRKKMLQYISSLTHDQLSFMERVNLAALKVAIHRVRSGREFVNFKLFEYVSGVQEGVLHEELMPSGKTVNDLVRSQAFLEFLVGDIELKTIVWSRVSEIQGNRELFIRISN